MSATTRPAYDPAGPFTCVKPVGGFDRKDGDLIACGDVGAFQSTKSATLIWCAGHVMADEERGWSRARVDWIPVDSDKAKAARVTWAKWLVVHDAQQAEREATKARLLANGPQVHTFATTDEAYTASQCGYPRLIEDTSCLTCGATPDQHTDTAHWPNYATEDVEVYDGDVLHVPSEGVTGFLYAAWPVAVTAEHGALHTLTEGAVVSNLDGRDYTASRDLALATARNETTVGYPFMHDARNIAYVQAVRLALAAGVINLDRYLTTTCSECDKDPVARDGEHIVVDDHVVVGCEGYFLINPNLVGIDAPNWQDWTRS